MELGAGAESTAPPSAKQNEKAPPPALPAAVHPASAAPVLDNLGQKIRTDSPRLKILALFAPLAPFASSTASLSQLAAATGLSDLLTERTLAFLVSDGALCRTQTAHRGYLYARYSLAPPPSEKRPRREGGATASEAAAASPKTQRAKGSGFKTQKVQKTSPKAAATTAAKVAKTKTAKGKKAEAPPSQIPIALLSPPSQHAPPPHAPPPNAPPPQRAARNAGGPSNLGDDDIPAFIASLGAGNLLDAAAAASALRAAGLTRWATLREFGGALTSQNDGEARGAERVWSSIVAPAVGATDAMTLRLAINKYACRSTV